MVKIGQAIDAADLRPDSKPRVKRALEDIGYDMHEEIGPAFQKLLRKRLEDRNLTDREMDVVMDIVSAGISFWLACHWILSWRQNLLNSYPGPSHDIASHLHVAGSVQLALSDVQGAQRSTPSNR